MAYPYFEMKVFLMSPTAPDPGINDYLAVVVRHRLELSQELPGAPFEALLIREETRWYDNDPTPDRVETTEASLMAEFDLPDAITAVTTWLLDE